MAVARHARPWASAANTSVVVGVHPRDWLPTLVALRRDAAWASALLLAATILRGGAASGAGSAELPPPGRRVAALNASISVCAGAGRWREALALLREAREARLRLDTIGFNASISACDKASRWDWAFRLLSDMRSERLHLDIVTYNSAASVSERTATKEPPAGRPLWPCSAPPVWVLLPGMPSPTT
mmetsp:Transcript_43598/g.138084  ORF Transcript_43598/g.138084 Transcript_43598/m.138084 type:complete len:186 (-) Transcript_43598:1195-1752(-)